MKQIFASIFCIFVLLFAGPLSSSIMAATDLELEQTIQDTIAARHPAETPSWWRGLGPSAPKVIIALYDKTSAIYRRLRLIEALGWYDDPAAVEFLKRQANLTPDDVIRNGSIRSVGNSQGAREVEFISGFLDHEDPQTRTTAGQTLRRIQDPRAEAALMRFYAKETLPWVKDRVKETPAKPMGSSSGNPPLLTLANRLPEDVVRSEFAGSWKGYLVFPAAGVSHAMRSEVVSLGTQIEDSTRVTGELTLTLSADTKDGQARAARTVQLKLEQVKVKGTHIQGNISGEGLKEWGVASAHFTGELQQRDGTHVLLFEFRELLMTLVIRRQ